MWFFIGILLNFILVNPLFAQTPATATAVLASPSATIIPLPTTIPTPTPHPAIALFEQYKNDYLFSRDLYQQAFLDYTQKKQVHTKYNTVTTHDEKIIATKAAITARNLTLKNYLKALRVKLDFYRDADNINTSKLQIELSKLEPWLDEQNKIVNTLNNDTDIQSNGNQFITKYIFIQQIIYSSLVQSEYNLRLLTLQQLNNYIPELQSDPTISAEGKQWVNSLIIKADNSQTSLNQAFQIPLQSRQITSSRFTNFYPNAKIKLVTANQYNIDIINDIRNILIKFSQVQ